MTPAEHPDSETLGRFVLGRLDRRTMASVEGHLRGCSQCGLVAMQVPDDRLVTLLRVSSAGPATEPSPCAEGSQDFAMKSLNLPHSTSSSRPWRTNGWATAPKPAPATTAPCVGSVRRKALPSNTPRS